MAIVGTAAVAEVAVVVLHSLDMLVADAQEQEEPAVAEEAEEADGPEDTAGTVVQHALVVAQQEIVVPCPLDDPVHIASHSNFAVPGIPALADLADLADVVVVLRFPLYLLYPTRLMRFMLLFCSCPLPLLWREAYGAFASQAYHNRCVLTSVCVLLLLTRPVNEL